ncbi:hypothetical protein GCAAIG_03550 [Candidatus Electronema halotolerans]
MPKQVPFINRENELSQIRRLIDEWNQPHIMCINAPGGIGKTRLLQEVRQRHLAESGKSIQVLEIADFDNPDFHVVDSVIEYTVRQFDDTCFGSYLTCLNDLRRMREVGISQSGIIKKEQEVKRSFTEGFNIASSKKRVIWFLDTTDALSENEQWWKEFANIGLEEVKNYLLLIAGRDARKIGEEILQKKLPVECIDLQPLEEKASNYYLKQKQKLLHISFSPDLTEKILCIADGRPIIIDLAVEWCSRGISLSWLTDEPIASLKNISQQRRKEFEKRLVCRLAQMRDKVERLILAMAVIYPIDVPMTAALFKINQDDAKSLLERSKEYVFVKSLPDGQVKLHDEMQRMVNEYVWPEADPDREYRNEYCMTAAEFREHQCKNIELEIAKLNKLAAATEQEIANLSLQKSSLTHNLLILKRFQINYLLRIDIKKGTKDFAELFDMLGKIYLWGYRDEITRKIIFFCKEIGLEENYMINSRFIIHHFDNKEYKEAKELICKTLNHPITPGQKIEMLVQLANIEIRLGCCNKGNENFKTALEISVENKLDNSQFSILIGKGYNYRLMGKFDEAGICYRRANRLRLELGTDHVDKYQTAKLLNNMSYLYALKRDRDSARRLCRQAEEFWKEIDSKRGIGIANSTRGVIHIEFDELDQALNHFDKALKIFSDENDIDYLSMVYLGQATVFWLKGKEYLEKSEECLGNAKELDIERDEPEYFHILGKVYLKKKQIDLAKDALKESYDLSQQAHNIQYELFSLAELARIAVVENNIAEYDKFVNDLNIILADDDKKYQHLQISLLQRCLGDLSLLANKPEKAVEWYRKAFIVLPEKGRYEPYTITGQLRDIQKKVLPRITNRKTIYDLSENLKRFWTVRELDDNHPEALNFFARWLSDDITSWGEE